MIVLNLVGALRQQLIRTQLVGVTLDSRLYRLAHYPEGLMDGSSLGTLTWMTFVSSMKKDAISEH